MNEPCVTNHQKLSVDLFQPSLSGLCQFNGLPVDSDPMVTPTTEWECTVRHGLHDSLTERIKNTGSKVFYLVIRLSISLTPNPMHIHSMPCPFTYMYIYRRGNLVQ